MTRDDVIRMAREAGFQTGLRDYADGAGAYPVAQSVATGNLLPELGRFAALVAAAEREACAQVCDDLQGQGDEGYQPDAADCAQAIRSRGAA